VFFIKASKFNPNYFLRAFHRYFKSTFNGIVEKEECSQIYAIHLLRFLSDDRVMGGCKDRASGCMECSSCSSLGFTWFSGRRLGATESRHWGYWLGRCCGYADTADHLLKLRSVSQMAVVMDELTAAYWVARRLR